MSFFSFLGDLFEQSLEDGFLNLSIVSLMFVGVQSPGSTSAKHLVFQQPLPTAFRPTSLVLHDIYFRADGDSTIKKIEPDHCDNVVLHSILEEPSSHDSASHQQSVQQAKVVSETVANVSGPHQAQSHAQKQSGHSEMNIDPSSDSLSPARQQSNTTPEESQPQGSLSSRSDFEDPRLSNYTVPTESLQYILECTNEDSFIKSMSHFRNKGKIELFNVFDCGSNFFELREILKVFVNNLSLTVLVVDGSQNIDSANTILQENQVFGLKELIIGTHRDLNLKRLDAMNAFFHQYSDSLVSNKESQPESTIFCINSKDPSKSDHDCASRIINLSQSLSASCASYPFSWYLFGFKLKKVMMALNRNTFSVSSECMVIANKLQMERSAVEAALEHLTEHNIVLYFRDILNDVVFSSIKVFSDIFSKLYSNISKNYSPIIHKKDLYKAIPTNEIVSPGSFIYLFGRLLILSPSDDFVPTFIVPCLMPLLDQSEIDKCHSNSNCCLLIKCPSTGLEHLCLLTVYLRLKGWKILRDSKKAPLCLYKNAVKMYVSEIQNEVTITFSKKYLKISASEIATNLHDVSSLILQGLENVKSVLKCYQNFNFKLTFNCPCGLGEEHTSTYDYISKTVSCDISQAIVPLSHSRVTKWLGNGEL